MQRPLAAEDLWTKIESSPPPSSDDLPDTTVLFVGDANSGKTTLINGFLKPNVNKEPKSTFALEYQFARKKGSGSSKNVSHIWELGGDMNELKILEIPIKAKILTMTRICIVLDLSKPQNILQSLQKWIKCVREIIKMRLMEIRGAAREEEAAIRANATAPFEEHVKDASRVRPCEVPLYIVCTKYDIFKTTPVNDRRNVMQLVRFIAHYHGASVLSCSTMDSSLKEQFKGLMSAICFHTNAKVSSTESFCVLFDKDVSSHICCTCK
jgi:dynein light intermediate chain 2